jgi:hypothetical protein
MCPTQSVMAAAAACCAAGSNYCSARVPARVQMQCQMQQHCQAQLRAWYADGHHPLALPMSCCCWCCWLLLFSEDYGVQDSDEEEGAWQPAQQPAGLVIHMFEPHVQHGSSCLTFSSIRVSSSSRGALSSVTVSAHAKQRACWLHISFWQQHLSHWVPVPGSLSGLPQSYAWPRVP